MNNNHEPVRNVGRTLDVALCPVANSQITTNFVSKNPTTKTVIWNKLFEISLAPNFSSPTATEFSTIPKDGKN